MNRHAEHTAHELRLLTQPATWLCAVVGALAIGTAHAANTPENLSVPADAATMSAKQAYEHDRDYCNSRESTEPRALCLKEAARAYQEDRAGTLDKVGTSGTGSAQAHHRARHRHHTKAQASNASDTSANTATTTKDQTGTSK